MCLMLMSTMMGGLTPRMSLREHCPTPRRHMQVGSHRDAWNDLEVEHIRHCERCRNIQLEIFRQSPQTLRGLIADDETHALQFLQIALRGLNAELTPVSDGDAALHCAQEALDQEQPYHFFPAGLQNAGLSGSEVAERLRNYGYQQPPMMIWTEWSENSDLQEQCQRNDFRLLCKNQLNKNRLAMYVESELAGLPPAERLAG